MMETINMNAAATSSRQLDVTVALARFEYQSQMGSSEFRQRFLRGEFGRVAWARAWFSLLA